MRYLGLCYLLSMCLAGCADTSSSCEEAVYVVEQLPYTGKVLECVAMNAKDDDERLLFKKLNIPSNSPSRGSNPVAPERQPELNAAYRLHYVLFQTIKPNVVGTAILDSLRPPNLLMLDACYLTSEIDPICRPLIKEDFFPTPAVAPTAQTGQPPTELQFEEKPTYAPR